MPPRRHFTPTEVELLLTTDNPQHRLLIGLGCATGFRISELLSLKVSHVLKDGVILDYINVAKEYMKGKKSNRRIKLNAKTKDMLQSFFHDRILDENCYLFRSRQGNNKPISSGMAWIIVRNLCQLHHIVGNVGTHSLRKTFAIGVYRTSGNDIRLTQIALGHAHIEVTIKYLGISSAEVDDVVDRM